MSKGSYLQFLRIVVAVLTMIFIIWGYSVYQIDATNGIYILLMSLLILVIGSFIIYRKADQMRSGEVIQDEMSDQILYKAGYYAFTSSILMWMFLGAFIGDVNPPRYLMYVGEVAMLLIFAISYLIIKKTEYR